MTRRDRNAVDGLLGLAALALATIFMLGVLFMRDRTEEPIVTVDCNMKSLPPTRSGVNCRWPEQMDRSKKR